MILKKFYKISMKKNALKCIVLLGLLWCGPLFLKAQEEALEDSSWKKSIVHLQLKKMIWSIPN